MLIGVGLHASDQVGWRQGWGGEREVVDDGFKNQTNVV